MYYLVILYTAFALITPNVMTIEECRAEIQPTLETIYQDPETYRIKGEYPSEVGCVPEDVVNKYFPE